MPRPRRPDFVYQLPLLLNDAAAKRMERVIRKMAYDDVLITRCRWRLEYLRPLGKWPQFRLYYDRLYIGNVLVRDSKNLHRAQVKLAAYLVGLGVNPDISYIKIAAAKSPLRDKKRGKALFDMPGARREKNANRQS